MRAVGASYLGRLSFSSLFSAICGSMSGGPGDGRWLLVLLLWVGAEGFSQAQTEHPGIGPAGPGEANVGSIEGKAAHKTVFGLVKSASSEKLVVIGKVRGKETEWTFTLDAKTRIKKNGRDATAADLAEGDAIAVRFVDRGHNVAQAVTARSDSASAPEPADRMDRAPGRRP